MPQCVGQHYKQGFLSTHCITHFLSSLGCLQLDDIFSAFQSLQANSLKFCENFIDSLWPMAEENIALPREEKWKKIPPSSFALSNSTLGRWVPSGLQQRYSRQRCDKDRSSMPRCSVFLHLLGSYFLIKTNLGSWYRRVEKFHTLSKVRHNYI